MLYLRPLQPSVWGLISARNAPETPKNRKRNLIVSVFTCRDMFEIV